jgi:hypothetical protein
MGNSKKNVPTRIDQIARKRFIQILHQKISMGRSYTDFPIAYLPSAYCTL